MRVPKLSECTPISCEGVLLPNDQDDEFSWSLDGQEDGMALFCDGEAYCEKADVYGVVYECPDCGWQKGWGNPDIP